MMFKGVLRFGPWAVGLLVALGSGCASRGPSKVPPDQFDYNQAIGQASNEQMLLNLIRLRYHDVPVFLAVNSVLTQYIYSGNANLTGSVGTLSDADADSLTASAGMRYIERPTITYSPLSGEEFATQLMTPVPGDLLFSLVQSGWPAVDLLSMGMHRLGALRNPLLESPLSPETEAQRREFRAAASLLLETVQHDGVEIQLDPGSEDRLAGAQMVFAETDDPDTAELIAELKRRLGLDPNVSRFQLTRNMIQSSNSELTIRVRSILDLMGYLSAGVQVPEEHIATHTSQPSPTDEAVRANVPLRIHSGPEAPEHAFVSVQYLESWFWIEAADEQSRKSFSLLTYLFLMMAPRPEGAGPLLTIPTG